MTDALAVVKRHFPVIIAFGGAVMIALGLLIVTGEFTMLNTWAKTLLQDTGLDVSSISALLKAPQGIEFAVTLESILSSWRRTSMRAVETHDSSA